MKTKKLLSLMIIALVAILMLTAVLSTAQAVNAASKVKVTWNANGGKISSAKVTTTTVTKGAKIGKLPKTPKKAGYAFKGWYTKKTSGTKITTATKVKKKVTYYAQWKKTLTTSEKKLVGTWDMAQYTIGTSLSITYIFKNDGTYSELIIRKSSDNRGRVSATTSSFKGSWSVSGNMIYFTDKQYLQNDIWVPQKDSSMELRFGSDEKGQYFLDNYDRKTYKS